MQCLIQIVWVGAEIANSLYRMCVFVISYILTRGKGAPPPPREDLCGAQSPDHLALETKVKIGPLSRCVLTIKTLFLVKTSVALDRPPYKQHSTCRRTASTSSRFVPAECDDTWSVVYKSGSQWFA